MQVVARAAGKKASIAERGVGWTRLAVVVLNTVIYLGWIFPTGVPWLAWSVIFTANLYSVAVLMWPPAPGSAFNTAVWTATMDALLIILWMTATGGGDSVFYPLWGLSIIAVAFRFNAKITRVTTVGYVFVDAALMASWGILTWTPAVAVRLGYLALLGTLGSFVAASNLQAWEREQALADAVQEAGRQQGEIKAIMDAAPSIIIRTDLAGRIQYINRLTPGFSQDQIIGASICDFVPPAGLEILQDAMQTVRQTDAAMTYELESTGPDGQSVWYRSTMGPVHQNGILSGLLIMTQDITEQRQQALDAERVRSSTAELDRLGKQDEFRKQLLNAVAHELNTPLTPLRLQLALLERSGATGVAMLQRNVDRLEMIVRDLLDLSRVESGMQIRRETVAAGTLIREVVENFEPLASRRRIRLESIANDVEINADPLRVIQVLTNLVSNAIRFSPDDSRIEVGASLDEAGCRLYVADEGLGLEPDEKEQVFRPFEQVHTSLDADMPGSGLGLHITEAIVKAHGGQIQVHSEGRNRGTRFECLFPMGA